MRAGRCQRQAEFKVWVIQVATQLADDLARDGVEVINCSRDTALHQFRTADLEAALCE